MITKNFEPLRKKAKQIIKVTPPLPQKNKLQDVYKILHELEVHQIELELQNDELQKALTRLYEAQKRYQDLYNFSPIGYLTINENNLIIEANLTCVKLFGMERKSLLNLRISSFIPKAWQSTFYKYRAETLSTLTQQTCEIQLLKKNCIPFYALLKISVFQDVVNHNTQLRIAIIDLSDRIVAEKALQQSEEKFRAFVENTKEWVWETDAGGFYKYNNPSIFSILGYRPQELLNRKYSSFLYNEDNLSMTKTFNQCISQRIGWNDLILRCQHKDGTIRYLESNATPIFDAEGQMKGFRGTNQDITLRIKSEEQIRQYELALNKAARTRSMGELASALAHELTQPLTAIINFTAGCVRRLETGDYCSTEILTIMRQAEAQTIHAGEIIHRMKDFVRQGKLYYENIDLNTLLTKTINISRRELETKGIKIVINYSNPPIMILGDTIQLGLVILNLIRNSIEAMHHNSNMHKKEIIIQVACAPKDRVIITLSDTGPGVPEEILEKIFNPCFSTKLDSLGVGLAIARTIVETHGGQLYSKKTSSYGASFEINLPITQKVNQ